MGPKKGTASDTSVVDRRSRGRATPDYDSSLDY